MARTPLIAAFHRQTALHLAANSSSLPEFQPTIGDLEAYLDDLQLRTTVLSIYRAALARATHDFCLAHPYSAASQIDPKKLFR
jgi:hypothetical protein